MDFDDFDRFCDTLGMQKAKVFAWMVDHMDEDGCVRRSSVEISKESGVSLSITREALRLLDRNDLVKRIEPRTYWILSVQTKE